MNLNSDEELVNMLIVYEAAEWNGHVTQWFYQECHPDGSVPYHTTLESVNQKRESGSGHIKSFLRLNIPSLEYL
ncbi:hypothetical protein TNCV_165901 [Trichonephila clavipes]|nr:hypothetical protein TNCV_165901 [Trichonephila clavipes]